MLKTLETIALWIAAIMWAIVVSLGLIGLALSTALDGKIGFVESAPLALTPFLLTIVTMLLTYPQRVPTELRRRASIQTGMALLLVLGSFACFVWPTPWRYWGPEEAAYRQNRFTGMVEVHVMMDTGEWTELPNMKTSDIPE